MITSLNDFKNAQYFINENEQNELNIETSILDEIVDMVGSEKDVEECAKEAFEELKDSFENNEASIEELESAEELAIASLIVKLVEKGMIGPNDADKLIGNIVE
tara:strand:- start:5102 stop:5413 length:312 start_codon:yes stop_codon:yes gene_type:complete